MSYAYYFAYGPDMNRRILEQIVGKAEVIDTTRIYGYELAFNRGSDAMSFANAERGGMESCMEGVLWRLTHGQEHILDKYYGWPGKCCKKYVHDSESRTVYLYAAEGRYHSTAPPSRWDVVRMLTATIQYGMIETERSLRAYLNVLNHKSLKTITNEDD